MMGGGEASKGTHKMPHCSPIPKRVASVLRGLGMALALEWLGSRGLREPPAFRAVLRGCTLSKMAGVAWLGPCSDLRCPGLATSWRAHVRDLLHPDLPRVIRGEAWAGVAPEPLPSRLWLGGNSGETARRTRALGGVRKQT